MTSAESSANPPPSEAAEAEVLRQLEAVREQLRDAQRRLHPVEYEPLQLDIGLDADLLAAFNAGNSQLLVLLIQIVRLLRDGGEGREARDEGG